MENFCWPWPVLSRLSRLSCHVTTVEPLPRPRFDTLLAARNFQSALHMLRQVE